MKEKIKCLKKIHEKYNEKGYNRITVYTKAFKATGECVKEETLECVLTLKNCKLYPYSTDCECDTMHEVSDMMWLNIFGKDIIAFSFHE